MARAAGLRRSRRRCIAKTFDLLSQPSRVVGCDALEHAHAFLELLDQCVSLRERPLEIPAARAPLMAVDRVMHLAGRPTSLARLQPPGPDQEQPAEHPEENPQPRKLVHCRSQSTRRWFIRAGRRFITD